MPSQRLDGRPALLFAEALPLPKRRAAKSSLSSSPWQPKWANSIYPASSSSMPQRSSARTGAAGWRMDRFEEAACSFLQPLIEEGHHLFEPLEEFRPGPAVALALHLDQLRLHSGGLQLLH